MIFHSGTPLKYLSIVIYNQMILSQKAVLIFNDHYKLLFEIVASNILL